MQRLTFKTESLLINIIPKSMLCFLLGLSKIYTYHCCQHSFFSVKSGFIVRKRETIKNIAVSSLLNTENSQHSAFSLLQLYTTQFFENLIWLKNCGSTDTHICIHYSNEYTHTICIAELFNLKNEMRLRELRRASYLLSTLIQSPYGASEKRSFLQ